jgi:hypothetical protein
MDKLKPERFVEMLKKDGIVVSIEHAACILQFLRVLADIAVTNHLHKGKQ